MRQALVTGLLFLLVTGCGEEGPTLSEDATVKDTVVLLSPAPLRPAPQDTSTALMEVSDDARVPLYAYSEKKENPSGPWGKVQVDDQVGWLHNGRFQTLAEWREMEAQLTDEEEKRLGKLLRNYVKARRKRDSLKRKRDSAMKHLKQLRKLKREIDQR